MNTLLMINIEFVVFLFMHSFQLISSRPRGAVDRASGSRSDDLELGVRTPLWDVGAGLSDETV